MSQIAPPDEPTAQERDLFRMFGLRHLASSGVEEAVATVRTTPISAKVIDDSSVSSIIQLSQTLRPFPGESVQIEGAFERTANGSFILRDRFTVSPKGGQTGFPHPSQHTGWALSEALLPTTSLAKALELSSLINRKIAAACSLGTAGESRQKALQAHLEKALAFNQDPKLFLAHHTPIFKTFAPTADFEPLARYILDSHSPFTTFSELCADVVQEFVTAPMKELKGSQDIERWKTVREHALAALTQKELPADVVESMAAIGTGLSEAVEPLLRRYNHQAGDLPPISRRILATAFKQLEDFLGEIEETDLSPEERLLVSLQGDCAILTDGNLGIYEPMVQEWEKSYPPSLPSFHGS